MKTHHLLYTSAGLLVILAGASGYLFLGDSGNFDAPVQAIVPGPATAPASLTTPSTLSAMAETASIEAAPEQSEEFTAYVSSLRASGVPESKVRELVSSKVAARYDEKQRTIESRPATTDAARREKQRLLDELPRVQQAVVAQLLNERISITPPANPALRVENPLPVTLNQATVAGPAKVATATAVPPLDPAVLVSPDPATPMSELQVAEWQRLEQDFIEQIGGPNQNPRDPKYRERWQTAQEISDEMFRQKFGTEAFLRFNTEAGRRGGRTQ
jgi:hypothetical protein